MKKIQALSIIAMAGCALLLGTGCSKTGPAGPAGTTGPAGPALTGNLKGHIYIYDSYGDPIFLPGSVAGTRDSLNPSTVAVSDSTGYYKFLNLSTGEYNFSITKPGYGSNMVQSLQLVGGGDLYRDVKISQFPAFNVTAATAVYNSGTQMVDFTGTIATGDTKIRTMILYVGKTASVSSNPANYLQWYTKNIPINAGSQNVTISIAPADIHNLGLNSGSTIYFAMYGIASNFAASSSYQDYATGRSVFTALSSTPSTFSVVAP